MAVPLKQILIIGVTVLLCLGFYWTYKLYKILKGVKEDFQSTATTGSNTAAVSATQEPTAANETAEERVIYDIFENEVTGGLVEDVPTTMEAYDPAAALGEFDEDAPVPWDYDNKADDPKDILWGFVDTRCSHALWNKARMVATLQTMNPTDVDDKGQLGYYSSYFGQVYHDSAQIAGIKYAEFLIDFGAEEVIESGLDYLRVKTLGPGIEIIHEAEKEAIAARNAALKAGQSADVASKLYNDTFSTKYNQLYRQEMAHVGGHIGEMVGGVKRTAVKAAKVSFDAVRGALKSLRTPSKVTPAVDTIDPKTARIVAEKQVVKNVVGDIRAGKIAAATAGRRVSQILRRLAMSAPFKFLFYEIPVLGQIIAVLDFMLNFFLIAILPQILADLADLPDDGEASGCSCPNSGDPPPNSGCDKDHPFNLRCKMVCATNETFYNIFSAIPYIGDGIAGIAPYVCTSTDGSKTVLRRAFRPPPFYFDSTLSLYHLNKPRVLENTAEYNDPSLFKMGLPNGILASYFKADDELFKVGKADQAFHPWVDFTHNNMLDKMADYYFKMSKRNAILDTDGNLTFEYIKSFRGLIASSQLSCDVQVEIYRRTIRPMTNEVIRDVAVPNPYEGAVGYDSSNDTGCSFHDRRFYFTLDYRKGLAMVGQPVGATASDSDITRNFNENMSKAGSADRLRAYREIFIVSGCTHVNGTAPDVSDVTADGNYVGDAPVGLGTPDQFYTPPIVVGNIASIFPSDEGCATSLNSLRRYGVNPSRPQSGNANANVVSNQVSIGVPEYASDLHKYKIKGFDGSFYKNSDNTIYTLDTGFTEIPVGVTPVERFKSIIYNFLNQTGASNKGSLLFKDTQTLPISTINNQNDLNRLRPLSLNITSKADLNTSYPDKKQYDIGFINNTSSKDTIPNGRYIYTGTDWTLYVPKPSWKNTDTSTWLQGSTKLWNVAAIDRSSTQRTGTFLQNMIFASAPLVAGFTGGMVVTTADVTGFSEGLSCTYQDAQNQTGTFVINGFTKTSEEKFMIDRGPTVRWAPGYTPTSLRATNPTSCGTTDMERHTRFPLTQRVCASRLAIRKLLYKYEKENPGKRIKRIFGIEPILPNGTNSPARSCLYNVQTVGIDPTDNSELQSTGSTSIGSVEARYSIGENSQTCEYKLEASNLLWRSDTDTQRLVKTPINITDVAANRIPVETWGAQDNNGALPCTNCKDGKGCTTSKCDSIDLINKFNSLYIREGATASGTSGENNTIYLIPNTVLIKTPTPSTVNTDQPVCLVKGDIRRRTAFVDANGNALPLDRSSSTQAMVLKIFVEADSTPSTTNTKQCNYSIVGTDLPVNYYHQPIPGYPPLEVPNVKNVEGSLGEAGCATDALKKCSSTVHIDRFVNQYNATSNTSKILRVTKAFTPAVAANATKVCDYEVDILRTALTSSNEKSRVAERDTVRFKLAPVAEDKCLYTITNADEIAKTRRTGRTILPTSTTQALETDWLWPTTFTKSIRDRVGTIINKYTSVFTTPTTLKEEVKAASIDLRNSVDQIQKTANAAGALYTCPRNATGDVPTTATTNPIQCTTPDMVKAFVNRYNFDNVPRYPYSQFGSTQRTIVSVRRSGLVATKSACQMEVIERAQEYTNLLKEPKRGTPEEDKSVTTRLRYLEFTLVKGDSTCSPYNFQLKEFTPQDISNNTMDVSTNPSALPIGADPATNFDRAATFPLKQIPGTESALSDILLNSIRAAVAAIPPTSIGTTYTNVKYQLTHVFSWFVAAPNILELEGGVIETRYNTLLSTNETVAASSRGRAYLAVEWRDWNVNKGELAGTPTVRTIITNGTGAAQVSLSILFRDDASILYDTNNRPYVIPYHNEPNQYPPMYYPPYMFWGVKLRTNEVSRIQYPNNSSKNAYLFKFGGTWPVVGATF